VKAERHARHRTHGTRRRLTGQVQVRGEIWRALPNDPAREIAAGQAVEIVRLEGLTARVKPAETP
jgi:membrane protein implicated in regulation of membrane protease activity